MKEVTEHVTTGPHTGIVKERDALKIEACTLRAAVETLKELIALKDRRIAELEGIIRGVTNAQVKQS